MTSLTLVKEAVPLSALPEALDSNWLLMLDVDGTLLDIAHRPDRVTVPLTLKETLLRLHDLLEGALVLVSGRPIADLDALFAPLKLPSVGIHGAEIRIQGDRIRSRHTPAREEIERLSHESRKLAETIPGLWVETKPSSVALHYRMNAAAGPRVEAKAQEMAQVLGPAWTVLHGKQVYEIKPVAFNKGSAVRALCAMDIFAARKPVYIGDDITDEDAFAVIQPMNGLCIKVGSTAPTGMPLIESPHQLRRWLSQLAHHTNGTLQTQPLYKRNGKAKVHLASDRRVIVVSNRVSLPRAAKANSGGLAVSMSAVLNEHGGMWFGWSDKISDDMRLHEIIHGPVTYQVQDISQEEYENFYMKFCNAILWPLLHYTMEMPEHIRPAYESYLEVNRRYARQVAAVLKPSDVIWVHDFHFIPLGDELRKLGVKNSIGFFLHIPFPTREVLTTLPMHQELMAKLGAYNVVGFQTRRDLDAFYDYAATENIPLAAQEEQGYPNTVAGHFPISIDTANFASQSRKSSKSKEARELEASLDGRALILGVDRMDYSKGLIQRLKSIDELLTQHPEWCKKFTFLQITPPTREGIQKYANLRAEIESLVGHINGKHAMVDWVPIRFLARGVRREIIAAFYRLARVCLVTPLRDGMNLVAKEYVAAQNPEDPGVLVLSRFAGASEELQRALLVNPYDNEEMVRVMVQALSMPKEERQERWRDMYKVLSKQTLERWYREYLDTLAEAV